MNSLLHILLLPLLVFGDKSCGSNLSDLWLDVMLVIDNSQNIPQQQLDDIKSVSLSVFGASRIGTTNYQDPRTTRIGIVDGSGRVLADLDAFQSTEHFREAIGALTKQNEQGVEGSKWQESVERLFESGRANGLRSSYKQVTVVFGDLITFGSSVDRLKSSGVNIVSVSLSPSEKSAGKSEAPSFNIHDEKVTEKLADVILAANCYCPIGWTQVQAKFGDPNSAKFASCLKPVNSQISWNAAKLACQNLIRNGFLVAESTAMKHDFAAGLANKVFPGMISYHIGLTYVNAGWYWQQPENIPLVKLGSYNAWHENYPRSYISETGVMGTGNAMGVVSWMNLNPNYDMATYMCEVAACDTSNHC